MHTLAQSVVREVNDKGNDAEATAANVKVILGCKKVLSACASPLPLRLSLMFAILLQAGHVPVFREFAGPNIQ